jgi:hypothetical protein
MANWEKLIEEHYEKKKELDASLIMEMIDLELENTFQSGAIEGHAGKRLSTKGTKKAGGDPFDEDPPKERSKSAPAGFGALEEESLVEKKGVAHPDKMGKEITDKSGNKLTLSQFEFIQIGDKVGNVEIEDTDTLQAVANEVTKDSDVLYQHPEKITKAAKAVIIVFAKDEKENLKSFIKYTKSSPTWQESKFAKETGWTLSGTQSSKEILAFGPSTLIGSGDVIPIANLPQIVINNAQGKLPQAFVTALGPFFNAVYNKGNSLLSFDSSEQRDKSMSSLDKYFGEIMAPVLLGKEHMLSPQPGSALTDAADTFKVNWTDASGVSYPEEANFPLVDSFLHFGDKRIGVSSKSKKGANPSVKNFMDLIEKSEKQQQLRDDGFGGFLDLIGVITKENSKVGPIAAALTLKIIGPADARQALSIINGKSKSITPKLDDLSSNHGKVSISDVMKNPELSKNPDYSVANHLIAGIAKDVANKVNKEGVDGKSFTDFAKAAYALSDMVQIYGKFSPEGDQSAKMENFRIIYPPLFDGQMLLDAGKNYYSSGQKGKLTIKIK